jgi:beta-fructofuranosidase
MYFSPGVNSGEIGDFDVVEHEGRLHVFYLALPSHDLIGHLVSDDGIHWSALPPAIRTGDPGEFDDDQIWTMGVVRHGGRWVMLYTANQRHGLDQVLGLATSDDLVNWQKHGQNPVACADPRWYERDQGGHFRTDWRDPHLVSRDGVLHAFLCARLNRGLLNYRGCAAHLTSADGVHWEAHSPASTPNNCFDYECPSVFELKGRFYMVAIHGGHDRATYRVADRIEGPYRRLSDDSITPGMNLSIRPVFWRGRVHLMHWNSGPRDWGGRRPTFQVLASPKVAHVDDAGRLWCESFDWSPIHSGTCQSISEQTSAVTVSGNWEWRKGVLHGSSPFGSGHWLTQSEHEDFEMTATVQLDMAHPAAEFGFLLRTDEDGDRSISTRCIPGRFTAEMVKLIHNRNHGPQSLWRGRSVLQQYHLPPDPTGRYQLRLIAYGPNVELNVNGRLALSHLTLPRRSGRVGLIIEDGRATFSSVRLTALHAPTTQWQL